MGSIPNGIMEFFIVIFLPTYCGPGVDSTSNRNEYQEYFLGGKGGRGVQLTFPIFMYHKIWKHQSPGTLRVCPGLYSDCYTFYLIKYSDNLGWFV